MVAEIKHRLATNNNFITVLMSLLQNIVFCNSGWCHFISATKRSVTDGYPSLQGTFFKYLLLFITGWLKLWKLLLMWYSVACLTIMFWIETAMLGKAFC